MIFHLFIFTKKMKPILSTNLVLKNHQLYQNLIQALVPGEELMLHPEYNKQRLQSVSAFSQRNDVVGTIVPEENSELMSFLERPDLFKIEATVEQLIFDDDMQSKVLVNIIVNGN